jgi:hypothetical protein
MAMTPEEKKRLLAIAQRAGGEYAAQNKPQEPQGGGRNGWLDFGLTTAGGAGGVAGGAAAGAAVGSIVPGIGTVIGGGIGALLGGALGGGAGQVASNAIQKRALDEGVAREAFFGSLGGAGKAFKALKLAKTAGKAADAGGDIVKIAKAADKAKDAGQVIKGARKVVTPVTVKKTPLKVLPDSVKLEPKDALYHGTTKENAESIVKNGFNTSLNKKGYAESPYAMFASVDDGTKLGDHAAGSYGDTVLEVRPKQTVQLLDSNSKKWLDTMGTARGADDSAEWAKKLSAEGYDGIKEPSGEIVIFKPEKFNIGAPGTLNKAVESTAPAVGKMGIIENVKSSMQKTPARMFAKAFTVPTKLAPRLKPVDTADEILKHGFGAKSLDDLRSISAGVTGQNGILTKTVRDAIGKIPKEVRTDEVITSVKNLLDEIPDLTDVEYKKIMNTVINAQTPGKLPGTMNPLDAFDNIKKLEDSAYQYINSSTYLTKNLKNEKIGRALLGGADELKMQLDSAVKGFGIVDTLKTPELMKQLQEISPRLAQQVVDAKDVADLRKIQAPFVRLGQMINLTDEAAQSVGGGFASGLGGRATGGIIGGATLGPLGALGGVFASPLLEGVEQSTRAPIATGGAALLQKLVGRADDAAGKIKMIAPDPSVMSSFTKNLPVQAGIQGADAILTPQQPEMMPQPELQDSVLAGMFDSSGNPVSDMATAGGEQSLAPTAGMFTEDLFKEYLLRDLAETGGKNFDLLEQLYGYFNPVDENSDLSRTQQQSLTKLGTADTLLGQIESQLSTVGLGEGPVGKAQGTFKSMLGRIGLNDNAAAYDDFRKGIATQLAKALGEAGSLSDQDIKRAIGLIPALNDTAGQAQLKLQQLRQVINSSRQNVYSLGGSQEDLTGDVDMGILTQLMGAQ